jgi:hypothetical protein
MLDALALAVHVYFKFFRSESPTQAFLITVLWLYGKFKDCKESGMSDEKCHVNHKTPLLPKK